MKIKLNPDQEIVNTIREGLKRTGGYCPCRRERTEATKCMCQEFKDQIADPGFEGFCHCNSHAGAAPAQIGMKTEAAEFSVFIWYNVLKRGKLQSTGW